MNQGKFVFHPESFEKEIICKMNEVSKEMDKTYKEVTSIMNNDIKGYDGWKGKQKEELIAFLDLACQFHKDLSEGASSPTDIFYKTICKFDNMVLNYEKTSTSYTNLKGIWES